MTDDHPNDDSVSILQTDSTSAAIALDFVFPLELDDDVYPDWARNTEDRSVATEATRAAGTLDDVEENELRIWGDGEMITTALAHHENTGRVAEHKRDSEGELGGEGGRGGDDDHDLWRSFISADTHLCLEADTSPEAVSAAAKSPGTVEQAPAPSTEIPPNDNEPSQIRTECPQSKSSQAEIKVPLRFRKSAGLMFLADAKALMTVEHEVGDSEPDIERLEECCEAVFQNMEAKGPTEEMDDKTFAARDMFVLRSPAGGELTWDIVAHNRIDWPSVREMANPSRPKVGLLLSDERARLNEIMDDEQLRPWKKTARATLLRTEASIRRSRKGAADRAARKRGLGETGLSSTDSSSRSLRPHRC